ncbi:TPA: hypothetical protein L9X63_002984 [Klebsiella pneumoniae]|nr:hypothetical protein [Klebsiella pneumoniae]
MKNDDVLELLESAKDKLNHFFRIIELAKKGDESVTISPIMLKEISEHLRSCLDYMAVDIVKKYNLQCRKIYFPYGKDAQILEKMNPWVSQLKQVSPQTYSHILSVQDFQLPAESQWLIQLCNLNILIKHNKLERPKKVNNELSVGYGGFLKTTDCDVFIHDVKIISNGREYSVGSLSIKSTDTIQIANEKLSAAGLNDISCTEYESLMFCTSSGVDVTLVLKNAINAITRLHSLLYQK